MTCSPESSQTTLTRVIAKHDGALDRVSIMFFVASRLIPEKPVTLLAWRGFLPRLR